MIILFLLHRSECSSLGGSLVSIHNKEENNFVFNLTRILRKTHDNINFYGRIWLGASCQPAPERKSGRLKGAYKWDDGTPWDYENWYPDYLSNFLCFCTRILEATWIIDKHDQVGWE